MRLFMTPSLLLLLYEICKVLTGLKHERVEYKQGGHYTLKFGLVIFSTETECNGTYSVFYIRVGHEPLLKRFSYTI